MARVVFTANLQRHVSLPPVTVPGQTVREVLEAVFALNPQARGYVLDEANALRKHMVIFHNGEPVLDRIHLSDAVDDNTEIYVMQALSGG
ncbi:MAG: MoaD/ThiS family protein [Planctomycetaceae bacterium]|nr:MoaD/ThiS family protein [Planctomycetaceae bacterium]